MLCEHCKIREATVKYVEVINGVKTEHNLCAQCARSVDIGQYSALFDGEFPLGKLLSGLLGVEDDEEAESRYADVICPTCGTTYEDFVRDSRFGCPDCYSVFDPLIGENIKRLQGSEKHVGKRPKNAESSEDVPAADAGDKKAGGGLPVKERLKRLQEKLQSAVRQEEYEEAAALRDQIKALKEEKNRDDKMV